jgi:hypothetical protein
MLVARSLARFALAGICEIGGGYLFHAPGNPRASSFVAAALPVRQVRADCIAVHAVGDTLVTPRTRPRMVGAGEAAMGTGRRASPAPRCLIRHA